MTGVTLLIKLQKTMISLLPVLSNWYSLSLLCVLSLLALMKQDVMLERPIQGGTEVLSPPYYEEQILPTATQ